MTALLRRILGACVASHAVFISILVPPQDAVAQDKSGVEVADGSRSPEMLQSELPDPEFAPHGPFHGPLEIAHIARFNDLPRRMFLEPYLIPPESVRTLDPRFVPFFDKTLREIDNDELLKTAANSLARIAFEKLGNIGGSSDILLQHLTSHSSLHVRFACARALVNGDLAESAAAVLTMDEFADDSQRLWMDPALARWNFAPAAEVWKRRLAAENETTVAVSLACDGLAALGDPQVSDLLLLVLQGKLLAYDKRRAAAKAICALAPDIALAEAGSLTAGDVPERLLGVELLSNAKPEAQARLLLLSDDASDGVASAAWTAMFRLNPETLLSALPTGRSHRDAVIRIVAARTMRLFPDAEKAEWLHVLMSDQHLEVRNVARNMSFLVAEEQASLRDRIIAMAGDTLTADSENWQGIEQSLLLLGQLRAAQFSDRCIPLLEHPRNEVLVTSAWMLHLFPDPAVEDAVRKYLLRNDEMVKNPGTIPPGADISEQLSYLIQYAGLMRLKDMEAILKPNLSKSEPGSPIKRAAAMWALGLLNENDPDPELASLFLGRLADRVAAPPEMPEVRRMSAFALGALRATTAGPGLLEAYQMDSAESVIADTARWALGMVGEPLPEPVKPPLENVGGWKLFPVGS